MRKYRDLAEKIERKINKDEITQHIERSCELLLRGEQETPQQPSSLLRQHLGYALRKVWWIASFLETIVVEENPRGCPRYQTLGWASLWRVRSTNLKCWQSIRVWFTPQAIRFFCHPSPTRTSSEEGKEDDTRFWKRMMTPISLSLICVYPSDGVCIDGKYSGLSKMMFRSAAKRDQHGYLLMCDTSWLHPSAGTQGISVFRASIATTNDSKEKHNQECRNPLSLGHLINHGPGERICSFFFFAQLRA